MKINKFLLVLLTGFFALLLNGCSTHSNNVTTENKATKENRIKAIVNAFVLMQYTDFDIKDKVIIVKDKGDEWEVYYELPITMLGGSPVVLVNKNSEKITNSYREQ